MDWTWWNAEAKDWRLNNNDNKAVNLNQLALPMIGDNKSDPLSNSKEETESMTLAY